MERFSCPYLKSEAELTEEREQYITELLDYHGLRSEKVGCRRN